MNKSSLIGVALIVVTAGVRMAAAEPCGPARPILCAEPKLETSFVSGVDLPESVATDHQGNVYISLSNTILQRPPEGAVNTFATLPLPIFALGVKVGPDGCVYTASTSLSAVPGAFVWRACAGNAVEQFAELDQSGAPNDLAFDAQGQLYVTDPVLARIWKISPAGNAEVFAEGELLAGTPASPALTFRALGANGIALDADQRYLYVSNTDNGTIVRVKIHSRQHTPSLFVQSPLLRGADGIAFDRSGTLLVAVNGQDSVVSVNEDRAVNVVSSGGLFDGPSSLAFGATRADRHSLYIISGAFARTLGFVAGTPRPALLSACVNTPG
jgi:hypothetical protein